MKKHLIWIAAILVAGTMALYAQQGRGGEPQAFGDKDKDGICDVTGKPVGQGRMAAGQSQPRAFGDKDKDGICDVTGKPVGQGRMAAKRAGKMGNRGAGCCRRNGRGQGRMGRRGMGQQQAPAEEAK